MEVWQLTSFYIPVHTDRKQWKHLAPTGVRLHDKKINFTLYRDDIFTLMSPATCNLVKRSCLAQSLAQVTHYKHSTLEATAPTSKHGASNAGISKQQLTSEKEGFTDLPVWFCEPNNSGERPVMMPLGVHPGPVASYSDLLPHCAVGTRTKGHDRTRVPDSALLFHF